MPRRKRRSLAKSSSFDLQAPVEIPPVVVQPAEGRPAARLKSWGLYVSRPQLKELMLAPWGSSLAYPVCEISLAGVVYSRYFAPWTDWYVCLRTAKVCKASGDKSGRTKVVIDSSPVGWGCFTSTSIGLGAGGPTCTPAVGAVGLVISSCKSRSVAAARSIVSDAIGETLKARTLARRLLAYFGKSSASCVTCRAMM